MTRGPHSDLSRGGLYRVGYYAWRLLRGNRKRGVGFVVRGTRGTTDERNQSDMVENHVVGNGVDESAIRDLLLKKFGMCRSYRTGLLGQHGVSLCRWAGHCPMRTAWSAHDEG
jgi:hypothetical protein